MPPDAPRQAAVHTAALVTHGRPDRVADALPRVLAVARQCGVELVVREEELAKHDFGGLRVVEPGEDADVDLCLVLGGDGTTLRALHRFRGTAVATLGVNFGRVGFLSSMSADEMEDGLRRAFAGDYEVVTLPTIQGVHGRRTTVGVNDIVLTSSLLGRMLIVEWSVDGDVVGRLGCDGAILATPTGSTAYNLSAGGPVLAWGADAFVLSFVSPHSLHARSLVLGRDHDVELANSSDDVLATVIVDGHPRGQLLPGERIAVRMGADSARLAQLFGTNFFTRYRAAFSH
jgi:NAD+ kinase